jgi:hypothetical protein
MKRTHLPPNWTDEKVKKVIKYYETQSDDEAAAEDDAAYNDRTQTFMEIPNKLVPSVRKLLAKHSA